MGVLDKIDSMVKEVETWRKYHHWNNNRVMVRIIYY